MKGNQRNREDDMMGRGYEIHLHVRYWKSKHFASDWSTTCNLDTYLRWHYVLENTRALSKKLDQLKAKNIHVTVEKEEEDLWVNIDLGKLEKMPSESDSGRIKSTVMEALMCDTDMLVTNSFPAIGIDRNEAVKLIMKKSREEMRNELWLYPDEDTDFIHYVYPATRSSEIDTCIKEFTKLLQEGERIEPLQLVFSKLFEQNNVKQEIKRIFKVTLAIDCLESENCCKVTIKGRMSEVEKGWSWINVKFLGNYIVNEIDFKNIRKLGTNISEKMIVEDVLSQPGFEHVTWCINETRKKIGICSTDRFAVDKATAALKRGIKREKFPPEFYQSLCDVQAVKEGRAILEKTDMFVQVTGTDKALTWVKKFVEKLQSNGQENKTTKQDQINKDSDQTQRLKLTEATIPCIVDDLFVFKRLLELEKLKACADKHSVRLRKTHVGRRGFLLTGSSDGCIKVKEILNQMIATLKQENVSANLTTEHWTLWYGNVITIKYPMNLSDVNLVVGVDTVPPEQAKFDRKHYTLLLPEWTDGCRKEKEKTEMRLKELLLLSLDECAYTIQINLPEIHKKIAKHFAYYLFTMLSGEEFKEKPPIELIICTDNLDMYTCLFKCCRNCRRELSSVLSTSASANHGNASEYELGSEATVSIKGRVDGNVSDGGETNQARIHETGSDSVSVSETVGVYKEADDSDSDETDSTNSDEAQDILVIVNYKRKVRNKLESFRRPLYLNLNAESYLKWQYICCKPDLLQDRLREIKKVAETAEYDDDRLRLFLGKQRNDPNFDTLTKEIQARFLTDADHLVVSWFPVHVSKSDEDIYNVLCKVLETSALQKRKEIYTDLSESGLIRLVYDIRHTNDVSELIQTVIKKYDETLRPEYTSKQMRLNAVLGQVFDQKQVNINASTKFSSVRMKYEIDQSTNKVTVDLYGPQEEVKEMHTWLNRTYVTPYTYESLPFADIKIKDKYVDTAKVLAEHFKNQSYKDLFWTINDYTREVSFCSIHELEVMKAISDAKDCLGCECITIENDCLEATEEIVKWLKNLGEFLERKVSLGITLEMNELKICITGGRVDAHSCIHRIKAYLREGGMQAK